MLMMTKKTSNLFDFVVYQNAGPIMNFLSVFMHERNRCYWLTDVAVKALHTTSQLILLESLFSDG